MSETGRYFVVYGGNGKASAIRLYAAKTPAEAAAMAFAQKEFAGLLEVQVVKATKSLGFRRANKAVRIKGD